MEAYTWVFRQIGKQGKWRPIQLAALPYLPCDDERITIQRFASPEAQTGDSHKSSFLLDFDAHADWLSVELCRYEVIRFLTIFRSQWGITPEHLQIFFSGNSGFHVTVPATLFGDGASRHLTTAYRRIASALKDTGLITLDAPSRHAPDWWWQAIRQTLGSFPLTEQHQDAFRQSLSRPGIYTRRRVIRRENSRHPHSGLYKVQLLPHELHQGMPAILALARKVRALPLRPLPPINPPLAAFLQTHLTRIEQEQQRQERNHQHAQSDAMAWRDDPPPPSDASIPICIERLLSQRAPLGSSNLLLVLLLSYCRARQLPEQQAIELAQHWLVRGVSDPDKRLERRGDAVRIARTVYKDRYIFARRFVAPHALAGDDECAQCPLGAWCWRAASPDAEDAASLP